MYKCDGCLAKVPNSTQLLSHTHSPTRQREKTRWKKLMGQDKDGEISHEIWSWVKQTHLGKKLSGVVLQEWCSSGLGIGSALLDIFVSNMESRIECTFSTFTDSCVVRLTCWRERLVSIGIWTGLRGEPWKVQKGQVQGPAQRFAQSKHKYRLGRKWLESSSEEKNWGWWLIKRSTWTGNVRLQSRMPAVFRAASKAVCKEIRAGDSVPLLQLWDPQHKKDVNLLEQVRGGP